MNTMDMVKLIVAAGVLTAGSACTTLTGPPDRTPSWMKYQIVGSRVYRRVDTGGQPDSANYVTTVEAGDLATLPSVAVNTRRR